MKTQNSYNTKYNTLWHNVGKLVGRKDQMNRNLKKERVTWYLCNVSTTVLYRYMLVILPNVWYRCISIFWGKSKHTHVRVQTHTIFYMHVRLQSCIPINMETYPQKQLLYCLILYTCMFLFRLKRLMLQKGKSKCFSRHSRDNISGAWSQIRPGKHCST